MYNFRYHIATLVAVFLALALGLFLGAAIVDSGTVSNSGKAMVDSLRQEFNSLRSENKKLSQALERNESLAVYLNSQWAKDRLVGKNILVITASEKDAGYENSVATVRGGGGTDITLILLRELTSEDIQKLGLASEESSVTSNDMPDKSASLEAIATKIVSEIALPANNRPTITALQQAGIITVKGADAPVVVSGAVDVATHEDIADSLGLEIARQLNDAGKTSLAGKTGDSESNIVTLAADLKLSTLDKVDGVYGSEGILALLSGAPTGSYGPDQDEAHWFPKLPE